MKWLPIHHNENYLISDTGLIYSNIAKRVLTPFDNGYGYLVIRLGRKSPNYYVHRLVAEHFLGDIKGLQVDHIDRNKSNNNVSNLRICTATENNSYLTTDDRRRKGHKKQKAIVEVLNNEISIGYISLGQVPNIKSNALAHHTSKNRTSFICNGRHFKTGVIRNDFRI